jgi:four helix bundle protein
MKTENILVDKSYRFALRIVKFHRYFLKKHKEYVLSRQVLRSGTSIGANVEESIGAQSDKDFLSKISTAYKEARETRFWLRLIRDSEYIQGPGIESLINDSEELIRIIASIQKTLKVKIRTKKKGLN